MSRICRRRPAWSRPGICTRRRCAADWWPRTGTRIRSPRWPAPRARYRTRNGCPGTQPGRTRVGGRADTTSRPRRSSGCCSKRGRLEPGKKKKNVNVTPASGKDGRGRRGDEPSSPHRLCTDTRRCSEYNLPGFFCHLNNNRHLRSKKRRIFSTSHTGSLKTIHPVNTTVDCIPSDIQ